MSPKSTRNLCECVFDLNTRLKSFGRPKVRKKSDIKAKDEEKATTSDGGDER